MTWSLNGKEFENVASLEPEKRYQYLIKKVADWEEIWSLWKDGWALMGDEDGVEAVPVWPHPMFAEAYAHGEWLGYTPRRITLDDWLNKWVRGMKEDHRSVAVFPVANQKTTIVTPDRMRDDLGEEMAKYE